MTSNRNLFTNLRYYKNETKGGKRTASKGKKSVNYYTLGVGEMRDKLWEENAQRGVWHTPNGEAVDVADMMIWVEEESAENKYTYTGVMSFKRGQMTEQDIIQSLSQQEGFADYRFMIHNDTDNCHAHVMMFRDKVLTNSEFRAWNRDVKREMRKVEREAVQAGRVRHAEPDRMLSHQEGQEQGYEPDIELGNFIDELTYRPETEAEREAERERQRIEEEKAPVTQGEATLLAKLTYCQTILAETDWQAETVNQDRLATAQYAMNQLAQKRTEFDLRYEDERIDFQREIGDALGTLGRVLEAKRDLEYGERPLLDAQIEATKGSVSEANRHIADTMERLYDEEYEEWEEDERQQSRQEYDLEM